MNLHGLPLTPVHQARLYAGALLALLTLGAFTSLAIVIAACWLLIQFISLCLESIIEALNAIGTTYQAADPFIRFLIILVAGYALYRAGRSMLSMPRRA